MNNEGFLMEEEKKLHKISYSNNKALLTIDDKIYDNELLIEDLEELIRLHVSDCSNNVEILSLASLSSFIVLFSKYYLKMDRQDMNLLIISLIVMISMYTLSSVLDKKESKNLEKCLVEVYEDEDCDRYTRMKIKDLKSEKDALIKIREKIITREKEIKDILDSYQKIKEK